MRNKYVGVFFVSDLVRVGGKKNEPEERAKPSEHASVMSRTFLILDKCGS